MRSACQFIINDGSQKFTWLTRERHLSFIHMFTSRSDFLTYFKTMKHGFSTSKDNLFTCNHIETFFNSELICVSIAFSSSPFINMLVSSANIFVSKIFETSRKSFAYDKITRPKYWPLRNTTYYIMYIRWIIIIHDILLSIYHIAFYPVQSNSSNTIVTEFEKQYIMI